MRKSNSPAAQRGPAKRKRVEKGTSPALPATIDLRIGLRPVDSLVPYARNAKKHSDAHVREIAASILEFGWTSPILADEAIRAGHGRQKAAQLLYKQGHKIRLPNGQELPAGTVPVIDCTGWSEAQKRAYVLADNKITENAEWDDDLLKIELGDLKSADFKLSVTGFDDAELAKLLAEEEGDDAPDTGEQLGSDLTFQVLVGCTDEAHQRTMLERFEAEGLTCRALIS